MMKISYSMTRVLITLTLALAPFAQAEGDFFPISVQEACELAKATTIEGKLLFPFIQDNIIKTQELRQAARNVEDLKQAIDLKIREKNSPTTDNRHKSIAESELIKLQKEWKQAEQDLAQKTYANPRMIDPEFPSCETKQLKLESGQSPVVDASELLMFRMPLDATQKMFAQHQANQISVTKYTDYLLFRLFDRAGLRKSGPSGNWHEAMPQKIAYARTANKDYRSLKKFLKDQEMDENGFPKSCSRMPYLQLHRSHESFNPFKKSGRLVPTPIKHQIIYLPIKGENGKRPFVSSANPNFDFIYCNPEKGLLAVGKVGIVEEYNFNVEKKHVQYTAPDGSETQYPFETDAKIVRANVDSYRLNPFGKPCMLMNDFDFEIVYHSAARDKNSMRYPPSLTSHQQIILPRAEKLWPFEVSSGLKFEKLHCEPDTHSIVVDHSFISIEHDEDSQLRRVMHITEDPKGGPNDVLYFDLGINR